jgi:hypothetical protein
MMSRLMHTPPRRRFGNTAALDASESFAQEIQNVLFLRH